ncbi:MAG: UDP-N-acetylglucosamine 2-epimerase (non-hydrolyzing) [Bacteroidales bacterium]|nr:UDP-N-acetylglucosamine 2-epimerase (non-hydrolyzing) [Bacteroidales bacterium]
MRKILTIIGARPQIIKAAAISRALRRDFSTQLAEDILHTGQHYDDNMSRIFFNELDIPQPHYNLGVGSGTHGSQSARMLEGIEQVLLEGSYSGVLVYGDTNSTLAGALAASKLCIPVFHVEAGLRSFNMAMPEEQNRLVADHLATRLYAPTQTAVTNLSHEGLTERTLLSGDIMLDNTLHYLPQALRNGFLQRNGLTDGQYILATLHRDFNTDNSIRLQAILHAIQEIMHVSGLPVVLPLHPRTANRLKELDLTLPDGVRQMPPVSYLEMLALEHGASLLLTDSGGVQKEAYFLQRPCVILRPETEWQEIVDEGAAILADADPSRILDAYHTLSNRPVCRQPLFGDGQAAQHIINDILKYIQ